MRRLETQDQEEHLSESPVVRSEVLPLPEGNEFDEDHFGPA